MKKVLSMIVWGTILILLVIGCEGPEGPIGPQGPEGPKGEAGIPCSVEDNDDGTFTLTCEGSDPVIFGEMEEPPSYQNADLVRGGRLYDKYWIVTGGDPPTGEHSLYPSFGKQTGNTTWRCKECHGWDYIGKDGRYSSGSHYTGINGIFPAKKSLWSAYMSIRDDHGFSSNDLSDTDVWDLVKFYREGMIDINSILTVKGTFIGDVASGKSLYTNGIPGVNSGTESTNPSCSSCHGADGTNEVVSGFDAFPGFLANDNPQEFQHKVRYGHPGSLMPASEEVDGSLLDIADLSVYSQTLSPILWSNTSVSRGGQLYDKYWAVTGGDAPSGEHAFYPDKGQQAGNSTWRCKECHGWDYIGKDGRYSGGSHYTGIPGLFPPTLTKWQAFEEIKNGHGYGDGELSEMEIWDLVAFYSDGMFDINFILNSDNTFRGSTESGQVLFENGIGGGASCASCHGIDGLNEVATGFDAFPGFLSNDNPQEFAHKVLYGQPGSAMVVTYDFGATLENVADLSAWAQTLPQN
jgi:mono/diheme cytochrome c family protein